jgi:uncharacterized membrane-anchored protein
MPQPTSTVNERPATQTPSALSSSWMTRDLAIKVPAITIWFWIIKVLCTTVGETAADYLNVNLHFGLTGTSAITLLLLVAALALQFASDRYVPWRYWLTVTLVSVFGTLVTDNLTDGHKVPLINSTIVFSVLLVLVFVAWYLADRSLSIHSIRTRRREAFYWLAVLVSFALGTATGDLMAERLGFGYFPTALIVAGLIAATTVLLKFGLNSILSFWMVYVLTRPLGASIGDYISQPKNIGGLDLGTTKTSFIFLGAIAAVVAFLTATKADVISAAAADTHERHERGGLWQTIAVVAVLLVGSIVGYNARKNTLLKDVPASAVGATRLGDLSSFSTIAQDTLDKLNSGDQAGATKRVDDLESAWDVAQAKLKTRDDKTWTLIDGKIDTVLTALRKASPAAADEKTALTELLTVLK